MARLRIPKRYLVIRKNDAGTIAIRNSKTGYFTGRIGPQSKSSYTGPGDKTHVIQIKKNIDVDGDGKIDFFGGTVRGKTFNPKSESHGRVVRASRRARGYERRL